MEDYPLISVVIPVYKVEKYIHECVDSIIAQTYKNLDIVLVDDGSPDNCPAICDEYAEQDSRIRVIHKKNGGLSSARNAGIDIAKGEYICFVDSDDYVSEIYVEQLYTTLKESGADMSCTRIALERKSETLDHAIIHEHELLSGEEALRKTLLVVLWSAYGGVPTAECLRRSAYGGVPTAECLRRSAYGGVPTAECLRRSAYGGVPTAGVCASLRA